MIGSAPQAHELAKITGIALPEFLLGKNVEDGEVVEENKNSGKKEGSTEKQKEVVED